MQQRLQKIIAAAGIASRRKAEELITAGRVRVNGKTVHELGAKADPDEDHISVDGRPLRAPEQKHYILLNKPKGYVSTVSDPEQRRTVVDLVRGLHARLYPVGRLDYHSEGLLLLTNDGDFAKRVTAAANHVQKTYIVKTNGPLSPEQEAQFRSGVHLKGKRTAPAGMRLIECAGYPWYE